MKTSCALTPFIGVRASWITTDLNVTYRGAGGNSSSLSNIQDQVHMQNNFYAWGIRAGLKANWLLGAGFELFGKSFLSALTGSHLFRLNEDFIDAPSGTEDVHAASHREKTWNSTLPCLELSGGINWGIRFYKDKLYIGFRFGYDYQLWFNLIRLNRYRYGNLPQSILTDSYTASLFSVFKNNLVLRGYSLGGSLHF